MCTRGAPGGGLGIEFGLHSVPHFVRVHSRPHEERAVGSRTDVPTARSDGRPATMVHVRGPGNTKGGT